MLMTVGSVPNTQTLGLDEAGVKPIAVATSRSTGSRRTSVPGVYAAGDCTGLFRSRRWPPCRAASQCTTRSVRVSPIKLKTVASAIFTRPEIASVGVSQKAIDAGEYPARTVMLPLATNPRAKMSGLRRGFVKIFCRPATGVVIGGVTVAPTHPS